MHEKKEKKKSKKEIFGYGNIQNILFKKNRKINDKTNRIYVLHNTKVLCDICIFEIYSRKIKTNILWGEKKKWNTNNKLFQSSKNF